MNVFLKQVDVTIKQVDIINKDMDVTLKHVTRRNCQILVRNGQHKRDKERRNITSSD